MVYVFDDYSLDTDRRELWRRGSLVPVQPQVFELLQYLISQRHRVVSKDDLIGAVWRGRIVSESTLSSRITGVRQAIRDSGEEQRLIRTMPRRGLRFVGQVYEHQSPSVPAPLLPLPDKPSIAVLPFQNMSGDVDQEYFADGMAEEIITALSRIRWLSVIARNSSFTYKGQAVDIKSAGRELGVRYLLEGSVRKDRNGVRITTQLIDALAGTHLWADRFDGSLDEIFQLQDRVAISVAGAIEPTLQAAETRKSVQRPTSDLMAYDFYLRALAFFFPMSKHSILQALKFLNQAIAIDPHYAPALSWAAICHMRLVVDGWAETPDTNRRESIELARRALAVTQEDPRVLANAAYALVNLDEDIGAMMALIDRALALNPSYARGWSLSGQIRLMAGRYDEAIEHAKTSLRLSPRERTSTPFSVMGRSYFFKRQFDYASANLQLAIQENPAQPHSYHFLAACYAHMGRLDAARATIVRLRTITDRQFLDNPSWRNAADCELLASGLRLAVGEAL